MGVLHLIDVVVEGGVRLILTAIEGETEKIDKKNKKKISREFFRVDASGKDKSIVLRGFMGEDDCVCVKM